MIRTVLLIACLFSLVWMPWPITLVVLAGSSIVWPIIGLVVGLCADALYAPHIGTMPIGLVWGTVCCIGGFLIMRFIKTHVLSA